MSKKLASITSLTNRQFYQKHKKSPEQPHKANIGKVLKTLTINKNRQMIKPYSISKKVRQTLMTENRDETKADTLYFNQNLQKKKHIQQLVKKMHPGWRRLLISLQKILQSQSIQFFQLNERDLYDTLRELIMIEQAKVQKQNCLDEPRMTKQKHNVLYLENAKLQKQNCILKDQLLFGKDLPNEDPLKQSKNQSQNKVPWSNSKEDVFDLGKMIMLDKKLQLKTQQNQIMKRELEGLKEQVFLCKEEKKSLQERIKQLKIKNQNLCSQVINLQIKNKTTGYKNEAIMLMQRQQIESYQRQMHDLRKICLNVNKKYKSLLVKFKKTAVDNNCKMTVLQNKQTKIFPQQLQAFEEIKFKFSQFVRLHTDNSLKKQNSLNQSISLNNSNRVNIYQPFLNNKETLNNREGVKKLQKKNILTQYLTPSFYYLILEDINFFGIDQNNFEHFNQSIKLQFIGTLRAIMDCKFNQFWMNKPFSGSLQGRNFVSFPTFVLCWLTKYHINEDKKIEEIKSPSRQVTCTFYANLMSQKLNNCWQIVTFREFLLQTLTIDELYFYLGLRNMVLGGDITQYLDYTFQQIYYIEYSKAFSILTKFVRQSDGESRKIIEQFLKRSATYIRKKVYIDMHYALRIMLEYYQGVKQKQIQKIIKVLDVAVYGKKNNFNYSDFCRIFDFHFDFVSMSEKIQLFRRCYCVGNGNISIEIILSVFSQEGIFLRWVDEEFFTKKQISCQDIQFDQTLDMKQNETMRQDQSSNDNDRDDFTVSPDFPWLANCQRCFRFVYNSQLSREISRLGIENISYFFMKTKNLSDQNLFSRFSQLIKVCLFIVQKRSISKQKNSYEEIGEVIDLTSTYIQTLSKLTLRKNQISELMRDLKRQGACNKILRFYQKKKMEMTRTMLYSYTKNLEKDENGEKTQGIRAEFMNIIENMRSKKKNLSSVLIE